MTIREQFRAIGRQFHRDDPEHAERIRDLAAAIQKRSAITGGGVDLVEAYVLDGVAYLAFPREQLPQLKVAALEDLGLEVTACFMDCLLFYLTGEDVVSEDAMNGILQEVITERVNGGWPWTSRRVN